MTHMKKRWRFVLLTVTAALLFGGCSGGDDSGACVTLSTSSTYTYCSNDWGKSECEDWVAQGEHTFHGGKTCEDLGYTYYCAKSYTYHMSSATCF